MFVYYVVVDSRTKPTWTNKPPYQNPRGQKPPGQNSHGQTLPAGQNPPGQNGNVTSKFQFHSVSQDYIGKLINNLKNKASYGHDKISNILIKRAIEVLINFAC